MNRIKKILMLSMAAAGTLNAAVFSYNSNSNYNVVLESQRIERANQVAKEVNSLYNFAALYILETGDENITLDKITKYFKLNKNNYKNYFKDGYLKLSYSPNDGIQISNIISSKENLDINNVNNVYISNAIKKNIEDIIKYTQNVSLNYNGKNYTISISEPRALAVFNTLKKIYSSYPSCKNAKFAIKLNPKIHSSTICKLNNDGTADVYAYFQGKYDFVKRLYIDKDYFTSNFLISTFANIAVNKTADGKKILNLVPGTIALVYDASEPKNERVLTPLVYTANGWVAIDFKSALASKTNLLINTTDKSNNVPVIDNQSDNTASNNTSSSNEDSNSEITSTVTTSQNNTANNNSSSNNSSNSNNTNTNSNNSNNTNTGNSSTSASNNKIDLKTTNVSGIPSSLHLPSSGWVLFAHIVPSSYSYAKIVNGPIDENMAKSSTSYILNNEKWKLLYNNFDKGLLLKDYAGRVYYISKDKILAKNLPSSIKGKCNILPKSLKPGETLFHVENSGCSYTGLDYTFIFLGHSNGQFVRQESHPVFDYWPSNAKTQSYHYLLYKGNNYINYYLHLGNTSSAETSSSNASKNSNTAANSNANNTGPVKYGDYTFYNIKELNIGENLPLAKKIIQGSFKFGTNFVVNSYVEGGDQKDKNPGIEIPLMGLEKDKDYIRLKLKLSSYGNYYKDYIGIYNQNGKLLKSFYTYGNDASNGVRTPHEQIFYLYLPAYNNIQRIDISEALSRYIYLYGIKIVKKDQLPSNGSKTDGLQNVVIYW